MMRTDVEFSAAKTKEEKVTHFLLENGFLSAFSPSEITLSSLQVKGADLSCTYKGKTLYVDLKLKNTGYETSNSPTQPSNRWSVEIAKERNGYVNSGWFVQADSITDLYGFLDASGESFDNIESVSCTIFSKKHMTSLIQRTTGKTVDEIIEDALQLLDSDKRLIHYNGMQLYKSFPDYKAQASVVNLCFDRDFIDCISKKTIIRRK